MALTKQLSSNLARAQAVHAETLLLIADYQSSRVKYELRQKQNTTTSDSLGRTATR